MKKPESERVSLPEQRALVVELSGLQKQLRKAVVSRQEREKLSIGSLAARLGLGWNEVEAFVNGRRAVCRGAILTKLAEYAEAEKLAAKIGDLAEKLNFSSRIIGASIQSKQTIELVFALHEKFGQTEGLNHEDFAQAFGDLQELVASVLIWRNDAFIRLEDEATFSRVMDLLTSQGLEDRISEARSKRAAELKTAVDEMEVAVEAIRSRYANFEDMCKALGVDASTVYRARGFDPRTSAETVRRITSAARRLLPSENGKRRAKPEPASAPAPLPADAAEASRPKTAERRPEAKGFLRPTTAMLRDNAGGVSEDNVKFVLTSETFQELDFHPGPRGIRFARSQLALTRALLNMFCQIKSPETRATVRQALSAEVEELEYAIRMFSEEYPNNLLALHDAARKTMGRMRLETDGKGKGAKR